MPLIRYEQYITFPDGSPAAEMAVAVVLLGGNVLVPLFSDKPGTLPLANPVTTDVDGLAMFYAAPGSFITELAGDLFHYVVSATEPDDAWPGVFVHEQLVLASVWTVEHHFGTTPVVDVQVVNLSTEVEVSHPDSETTVITFGAPAVGTALLRR